MRLTAHHDARFDPRLVASRDIRRAEIARIRQQAFGLAETIRKSPEHLSSSLDFIR